MTILYRSDDFQLHETGAHPEQPGRLRAIDCRLADLGLIEKCQLVSPRQAEADALQLVHPEAHLAAIEALATTGADGSMRIRSLAQILMTLPVWRPGRAAMRLEGSWTRRTGTRFVWFGHQATTRCPKGLWDSASTTMWLLPP